MFGSFEHWILSQLAEGDVTDALWVWLVAVVVPVPALIASVIGFSALFQKPENKGDLGISRSLAFGGLAAFVAGTAILLVVIRNLKQVVALTISAGGMFLVGAIACLAAFPVGWLGFELRVLTVTIIRRYHGPRRAKALRRGALGLLLLAALDVTLYVFAGEEAWRAWTLVAGAVLALGFFGLFFVPIELD